MFASGTKGSGNGFAGFQSYAKARFGGSMVKNDYTKMVFNIIVYDNLDELDIVTNGRWTASENGVYLITVMATVSGMSHLEGFGSTITLYKNGVAQDIRSPNARAITSFTTPAMLTVTMELEAGDYIEAYFFHNSASDRTLSGSNNYATFQRIA